MLGYDRTDILRVAALSAVYFLAAKLGLALALVHNTVTLFWPPSGIALASLLIFGWRLFPAIAIGEFLANLSTGLPLSSVAGISCGNMLEGLLGYILLGRCAKFDVRLHTLRDVGSLFLYGVLLSPLLAAFNGAWWIKVATGGSWADFWHTMQYWWMGDALGVALFTTLILAWLRGDSIVWGSDRIQRGILVALLLLGIGVLLYQDLPSRLLQFGLLFPLLIWIALNFDLRCVSGALLMIFMSSMLGLLAVDEINPASMDTLVNYVWLYNLLFALTAYSVAVLNAQRNRSEKALHVSEDNLKRAQEVGGLGSWNLDVVNNHLQWSDQTYRIFGMQPGTPLDYETFIARVHPEDRELVDRTWRDALLRKPYEIEHRILVDGQVRWVREKADLDFDAKGQAVFAVGTVRDTTRSKQEESAQRLASRVFESSGEAILITDERANVVAINHAFVEMTGYGSEEVMGQNPRLLASGRHDAEYYHAMWNDILVDGYWQGEIWDKHKTGRVYPKWMSISAVRDEQGRVVNYVSISRDITERNEAERNIHFLAYYDVLTGLPNRTLLRDRLGQMIAVSHRDNLPFALLFLDLDRFKYINDSMGHSVGDRLLQSVALRIQECLREGDTVARLGGDEFIVLLRESDEAAAVVVAKKLLQSLSAAYDLDGLTISTRASIGISIYPDHSQDADTLIRNADMAMYHAKEQGRDNYQFFTPEMNFRVDKLFSMEKDLRVALEQGQFELVYQPQADLTTGAICGVEALVRWQHPEKGYVSPADFIPIAEETGQIVEIGEWVLRAACAQRAAWLEDGMGGFSMAVNLSMRQLRQPALGELVKKVLAESGLEPRYLELEITEGIMMGDNQAGMRFLDEMHAVGVQLSIDDFGTGYSSLNYLKKLPVDKLKIDQSFTRDIETDESDAAIIRSIISLGHRLNLRVIAEGVETQEQLDFLRIRGSDEIQGYFYARPMPAAEIVEFVRNPPRLL